MSDTDTDTVLDGKPWYASKTIWGGIIAAAAPFIGLALHFQIDPDLAQAVAAALASVGGVVAIVGRVKATGPIQKKS